MVPNSLSGILTGAGSGSRTRFYLLPTKHTKGADGEKRPVRLEPAVSPSDQPRKTEPHIPSGITPGMTRGTACRVYARPSGGDANIAPPPCAPRRPVLRGIRAARYRRKSCDRSGTRGEYGLFQHLQRLDADGDEPTGLTDPMVAQRRINRVSDLTPGTERWELLNTPSDRAGGVSRSFFLIFDCGINSPLSNEFRSLLYPFVRFFTIFVENYGFRNDDGNNIISYV